MLSLLPVARSNWGANSSIVDVSATDVSTLISAGSATAASIAATDANSNPAAIAPANLSTNAFPAMVILSPKDLSLLLKERVAEEFGADNLSCAGREPRDRCAPRTPCSRRHTGECLRASVPALDWTVRPGSA